MADLEAAPRIRGNNAIEDAAITRVTEQTSRIRAGSHTVFLVAEPTWPSWTRSPLRSAAHCRTSTRRLGLSL